MDALNVKNTPAFARDSKDLVSALITVVIPIYNVEPYLRKCIDSVVGQTYTNLEIILVDDGSNDNSPNICDEYAAKDKRIHVIHKRNGGVSSARNTAIDIATGQYIAFVDSDDYIEKDMLSFLYNNLVTSNSDMSTCGFNYYYENIAKKIKHVTDQVYVLETEDAIKDVLYNKHSTLHPWGKLYKTSLFDDIRFPEGKIYEDAGTTYKLISKSKRVCFHTSVKYNYLLRQGSITGSAFTRDSLDSLEFAQEIVAFVKKFHPGALRAAESYLFSTAVTMIYLILCSNQRHAFTDAMVACRALVLVHRKSVSSDKAASRKLRAYAYASRVHIYLLYAILITQNYAKRAYIFVNKQLRKRQSGK